MHCGEKKHDNVDYSKTPGLMLSKRKPWIKGHMGIHQNIRLEYMKPDILHIIRQTKILFL